MTTVYEQDPDVARWGLHVSNVCSLTNDGSSGMLTHYHEDFSRVEYVQEDYCESKHANVENDEIIAHAFQEELLHVAAAEASGYDGKGHQKASILGQDWCGFSKRDSNSEYVGHQSCKEDAGLWENISSSLSLGETSADGKDHLGSPEIAECSNVEAGLWENFSSSLSLGETSVDEREHLVSPEIADESTLDGEVGKRLNQMFPVPHVPRINGEIPSEDEAISDHQTLLERLQLYDLVELKVSGDGNCQFRSLSDQIYRTPEFHDFVRQVVVDQLKSHPELYAGYLPMAYDDYLKKMSKTGEWGDHVTLQAAADSYGVKIFILTSFKDTCYVEILPRIQKSNRIVFLSFWAEVHYNSIYPQGDPPESDTKKKKGLWWPASW